MCLCNFSLWIFHTHRSHYLGFPFVFSSDVSKARTLKAKAIHYQGQGHSPKAMAIPMQRLTMKYEVMKSCFFQVLLQGYKHSLITSLITDMIRR